MFIFLYFQNDLVLKSVLKGEAWEWQEEDEGPEVAT